MNTAIALSYPCANTSCDRRVSEPHSYCCGLCASRRDRGVPPPHSTMCVRHPREKTRV